MNYDNVIAKTTNAIASEKAVNVTGSFTKESSFVKVFSRIGSVLTLSKTTNAVASEKAVNVTGSVAKESSFVKVFNRIGSSITTGYANSVNYLGSKQTIKTILEFWS
jgi:hypothetical protein